MDDLISRQAVLDILEKQTVSTNPDDFMASEKFIQFMDDQETSSFGRWQYANGFNTALVAIKCELPKRKTDKWIPCSERLPEFPCLVSDAHNNRPYVPHGIVTIKDSEHGEWAIDARFVKPVTLDLGDVFCDESLCFKNYANRIIAWMPLPEPYRED